MNDTLAAALTNGFATRCKWEHQQQHVIQYQQMQHVADSRSAQTRFVQTQAKTFLCLFIDKMTEDYCVAQSAEVFQ